MATTTTIAGLEKDLYMRHKKQLNNEILHQRWTIEDLEEKLRITTIQLEDKTAEFEQLEQEKEDLIGQLSAKDYEIERLQSIIRRQSIQHIITEQKKK